MFWNLYGTQWVWLAVKSNNDQLAGAETKERSEPDMKNNSIMNYVNHGHFD